MRNVSFFVGDRALEEEPKGWQSNWAAVRATIGFVQATARLEIGESEA
jgi:hypothetical protein